MKTIVLAVTALLSFAFIATKQVAELEIGAALPNAGTEMANVDGKNVSFKSTAMKNGLLVMFSCNTCPYVIKNQERTVAIARFALQNNIGVMVVNSNEALRSKEDSYAAMQNYAKEQNYDWPYVLDENSAVADAFGANRTPECFLFDSELKLAYHGAIDDNPQDAASITRKHLEIAITEMTSKKEISTKTSKSVGCTIKRKKG